MGQLAGTVQQVAERTMIGEHEIRRAIRDGELRVVMIGRRRRIVITWKNVEAWLEARSKALA